MAKKNGMSREEASAFYENLQASMKNWMANNKGAKKGQSKIDPKKIAETIRQGLKGNTSGMSAYAGASSYAKNMPNQTSNTNYSLPPIKTMDKGQAIAIMLILFLSVAKVFFSALNAMGVGNVSEVQASTPNLEQAAQMELAKYSKEDQKVLTSLDARRAELAERDKKIDQRELDLNAQESELEMKLAELRQLTSKLKTQREGVDEQHALQVQQLAKIYSAMPPEEAAKLIEDLDSPIAIELMKKMSEKRIGQILSLMDKSRAIKLSKMIIQNQ